MVGKTKREKKFDSGEEVQLKNVNKPSQKRSMCWSLCGRSL